VQYFKGRTIEELRASTANDAALWPDDHEGFLDARAYYAGKTASDGVNRYIWGWCPTRSGQDNTATAPAPAEPNWGGTLVPHRVIQHEDGTLTLGEVPAIKQKYAQAKEMKVMELQGEISENPDGWTIQEQGYLLFSRLTAHNRISMTVTTANSLDKFGISLCRGTDADTYYTLVFNPESDSRRKVNFEEEGPKGKGFIPAIDSYTFNTPPDNTYHITICTDNSVLTMYVNDVLCYTNRIYGMARNCWSVNAYNQAVITLSGLTIYTY